MVGGILMRFGVCGFGHIPLARRCIVLPYPFWLKICTLLFFVEALLRASGITRRCHCLRIMAGTVGLGQWQRRVMPLVLSDVRTAQEQVDTVYFGVCRHCACRLQSMFRVLIELLESAEARLCEIATFSVVIPRIVRTADAAVQTDDAV